MTIVAKIADESGVHMILVGDSLGMVIQENPAHCVTMDEMIYHTRIVAGVAKKRGHRRHAVHVLSAGLKGRHRKRRGVFLKETYASAVKLEGRNRPRNHKSAHRSRHSGAGHIASHRNPCI
jgi:3-methyl-2-oxobutanoate hydroxymethyltransferase